MDSEGIKSKSKLLDLVGTSDQFCKQNQISQDIDLGNQWNNKISEQDHIILDRQPRGDVELFEQMFNTWKHQERLMESVEKDLLQQLYQSERSKTAESSKVKDMEKTIDLLQNSIHSLHNELNLLDLLEKENIKLKDCIKEKEKTISSLEIECKEACMKYVKEIQNINNEHKKIVEDMQMSFAKKLEHKNEEIAELLKQKTNEIDKINKEKQSEISLLTLTYENKLAKLMRHKVDTSVNQHQSSSNEIFRNKLQHLKSEYEQELKHLKEQIKELQGHLSNRESNIGPSPSLSMQPFNKRFRKY